MAPQHLIVCLNTRIMNIEVTSNATEFSAIEIATFFIKPHHLSFVKSTCSICNKRSLLQTQWWICNNLSHKRNYHVFHKNSNYIKDCMQVTKRQSNRYYSSWERLQQISITVLDVISQEKRPNSIIKETKTYCAPLITKTNTTEVVKRKNSKGGIKCFAQPVWLCEMQNVCSHTNF